MDRHPEEHDQELGERATEGAKSGDRGTPDGLLRRGVPSRPGGGVAATENKAEDIPPTAERIPQAAEHHERTGSDIRRQSQAGEHRSV